jgi:hypothetical protein
MTRPKTGLWILCIASAPRDTAVSEYDQSVFGTTHGHSNWSSDSLSIGNQLLGSEVDYDVAFGDAVTHHIDSKARLQSMRAVEGRFKYCQALPESHYCILVESKVRHLIRSTKTQHNLERMKNYENHMHVSLCRYS